MFKRQDFIDWAKQALAAGEKELVVVAKLKLMNSFYLWVFDHVSTTHLDTVLDVEAWGIISAAQSK